MEASGPSTPLAAASHRIPEIEGIRGLLSVVVLLGHADYFNHSPGGTTVIPWFWAAMEIFFVLSGYLISDIVFQYARTSTNFYRTFFLRRCLRIWPLYYAVLLFCIGLTYIAVQRGWMPSVAVWPDLVQCFVFLQNIELTETLLGGAPRHHGQPYAFGHSWSLALEEQFYVLCALLVPLFISRTNRIHVALPFVLIATILVAAALRLTGMHWWLLGARFDAFGLGMLLATMLRLASDPDQSLLSPRRANALVRMAFRCGGISIITVILLSYMVPIPELNHEIWGQGATWQTALASMAVLIFSVFGFGLVGTCVIASGSPGLSALRRPWIRFLGEISYSTYLWHIAALLVMQFVLENTFGVPDEFSMLAALAPVLALSYCSYTIIERPFLNLGRRVHYSRISTDVAPACPGLPERQLLGS